MSNTILVVDDESQARENIERFLLKREYQVIQAPDLKTARDHINKNNADIILLDVSLPDGYGPNLLDETAQLGIRPPVILITAYGEIEMAVDAMKKGAHDFLQKPVDFERLETSLNRAKEIVSIRRQLAHYRSNQQNASNFVIGKTEKMQDIVNQAQRAAESSVSVLITGKTGTGKEVLAQAIHQFSPRRDKPFIGINCAAIQETMLESELFGFEAGAFTGAVKRKSGMMEVADDGILFLDEIALMSVDMQAKLLRALEERSFYRIGGNSLIHVDVLVLAASNRDLKQLIKEGKFREDLYYRLKIVDLDLPNLSDRKDDIPELIGMFIKEYNGKMGKNVLDVTQLALEALMDYDWPGNIRELKNAIERAMLFCDDPQIDLCHLPNDIKHKE